MTPREQLADVLQRSRAEAGYGSQGALAKRLNVSRPVVSKAENPAQPCPSDAILAAWAGATGCPLDRLTELAEQARSGVPDWFVPWRAAETSASLLRYWQPWVVPGIAQTRAYMMALFTNEGHSLEHAEELAAARTERQAGSRVRGRHHHRKHVHHPGGRDHHGGTPGRPGTADVRPAAR